MSGRRAVTAGAAAVVVAAAVIAWASRTDSGNGRAATEPELLPSALLSVAADEPFPRVEHGGPFAFPGDHAAHPAYRTEWWHLIGTLSAAGAPPVAVQWLVLRIALAAEPPSHESDWATSNVYAGLLSVGDPRTGAVSTAERVSRAALELAGTAVDPVRVWVEDWRLEQTGTNDGALDFALRASTGDVELELELDNEAPLVDGARLSGGGAARGAPFRFYLQPRLGARGTLRTDADEWAVTGTFSIEHAWGELPLPGGPIARDRFVLHLEDERVLLGVRTHRADGSGSPETAALLVRPEAGRSLVSAIEIELEPTEHWTSPRTNARYPIRWALRLPGRDAELTLTPYRQDQEGVSWLPFWAGAVRLDGEAAGESGLGVLVLSGYE